MDEWVQDKVLWFVTVFGTALFGGILSVGKLYNRVKQLEKNEDVIFGKIDTINKHLDGLGNELGTISGKLDTLITLSQKE